MRVREGVGMDPLLGTSPVPPEPGNRPQQDSDKGNDIDTGLTLTLTVDETEHGSQPPLTHAPSVTSTRRPGGTESGVSSPESERHTATDSSESVSVSHPGVHSPKCDDHDTSASESSCGSADSEVGSENDVDLAKSPSSPSCRPTSVMPTLSKLLIGSESEGSAASSDPISSTSSSEHNVTDSDTATSEKQKQRESGSGKCHGTSSKAAVQQVLSQVTGSLQGFLFGPPKKLQDYLTKIVSSPRDFGIYMSDVSSALFLTAVWVCLLQYLSMSVLLGSLSQCQCLNFTVTVSYAETERYLVKVFVLPS